MSTAVRSKDAFVAEFKNIEMFSLLAKRSQKDFDRVMEAAWGNLQKGATDAEVTTAVHAQLTAVLPRFLPLASDEPW